MLTIIQGDSVNLTITVETGADLVEELWFSSNYLGISKQLKKLNDTQWLATFETDFTCNCKVCKATFDITAILKDNQVSTVVYQDDIKVLKKENTIDGN